MTVYRDQLAYKYRGLSTDTKPIYITGSTGTYVPAGSEFFELDTCRTYVTDGSGTWYRTSLASIGQEYVGTSTETKPTYWETGSTTTYLPEKSKFYETDTREIYIYDGAGSWSGHELSRYNLDDRVSIAITTTSSHLYAGDSLTKRGDLLRQYTIKLGDSTGDPTRTMSIVDSNSATVWASTAITDSTTITRLLPTSEQVILDGVYTVVWTLSTNSPTTGITDYYTLGFDRG